MNIKSIRRILTLSALAVAALASTIAQAIPQPVFLISPGDGATIAYDDAFTWSHGGADVYILKFTIMETGEKLKSIIDGDSCGIDECSVTMHHTALFNAVKDGQFVKWRVVAKYGTQKVKSVVRTLTADMVNAPVTSPTSGALIEAGEQLIWTNHPVNQSYTVIVRHVPSNTVVIKESMLAGECVLNLCAIEPHALAELQNGAQYKWFVKATGFNGEKAKSAKHTFTTPFAEVAGT
jgi:hypothetical protein